MNPYRTPAPMPPEPRPSCVCQASPETVAAYEAIEGVIHTNECLAWTRKYTPKHPTWQPWDR